MRKYDVAIIGGGTAGCSCAWNCARLGLKTVLIEKKIHLGGTMTSALVVPVMKSGEHQINTDFYNALVRNLKEIGGQVEYQGNSGWFNPELLKIELEKLLNDVGVDVVYKAEYFDVIKRKEKFILSVYNDMIYTDKNLNNRDESLLVCIETSNIVDATANADFCKKIGCNFLNDKNYQPISLRFIMSGINLKAFGDWLLQIDSDRNVTSVENIDGITHLSTAYTWDTDKNWALAPYFSDAIESGIITSEDSNYFQVFSIPGMPDSLALNCPRIVKNIDPADILEVSKALINARKSILRLSNFCKKYFPGFENSYISNIADELGVRVSSRVQGKYVYTIDDLRSGKKFKNPALISDYPVDIHSDKKDSSTLEFNKEYQLPIESLITDKYDNVYVIGRCLSADFMSQAALRVQSSCFSMGEAVAKDIKLKLNEHF